MEQFGFTLLDLIALVAFCVLWFGYGYAADHGKAAERSLGAAMGRHRERWINEMTRRDNRVPDVQIARNQMNGAAFFASAAIFAAGGAFALLGATKEAMDLIHALPIAIATSANAWAIKLLILVAILAHAFFKFAWAFRLYNYCSVLIGGTGKEGEEDLARQAARTARMNNLAASHFNRGLRVLYFALAFLGWFIHPLLLIIAATWVVLVLYRREFRSRSLRNLTEGEP